MNQMNDEQYSQFMQEWRAHAKTVEGLQTESRDAAISMSKIIAEGPPLSADQIALSMLANLAGDNEHYYALKEKISLAFDLAEDFKSEMVMRILAKEGQKFDAA